jgi:hypothetical protein
MEFDLVDLDRILMHLTHEQSMDVHNVSTDYSSTTEQSQQSNLNEQQTPITTTNEDRHYCLIIFNNPTWSQRLRKRSDQV